VFVAKPALHRYPAVMARRVHDLSGLLVEEYDADDYLHVDLIGCRVTSGGREVGTVADVLVYPANDVLDIRGGEEPVLVPFAADVIVSVDIDARHITIRDDFL